MQSPPDYHTVYEAMVTIDVGHCYVWVLIVGGSCSSERPAEVLVRYRA